MVALVIREIFTLRIESRYHLKLRTNGDDVGILACCCKRTRRNPDGSGRCHGRCTRVCIYRINTWSGLPRGIKILLDTGYAISIPKAHISVGHAVTVPHSNVGPESNIYIVHYGLCRWVI